MLKRLPVTQLIPPNHHSIILEKLLESLIGGHTLQLLL